jgi:hypothetical protein
VIASHGWEEAMTAKKTRLESEMALLTMLASLTGKAELEALADRYVACSPGAAPMVNPVNWRSWSASAQTRMKGTSDIRAGLILGQLTSRQKNDDGADPAQAACHAAFLP